LVVQQGAARLRTVPPNLGGAVIHSALDHVVASSLEAPSPSSRNIPLKRGAVWGAAWVWLALVAGACNEQQESAPPEPVPANVGTARQAANSGNKVLILDSTVSGGLQSQEARAAQNLGWTPEVVTPAQWKAMTSEQFMSYRALVIGDAACTQDTAVFEAALETRDTWGQIIDGTIIVVGSNPASNSAVVAPAVDPMVRSIIRFATAPPNVTGLYVALGCAYRNAPEGTQVELLSPFGGFQVAGVGCVQSGFVFYQYPDAFSRDLYGFNNKIVGKDTCAAKTVFTAYPDHDFSIGALAETPQGGQLPGDEPYFDYYRQRSIVGTPFILTRGATNTSLGCGGHPSHGTAIEECDRGDGYNGAPAAQSPPEYTCSWSCRTEWCGDGKVQAQLGEECDDGEANGRDSSGNLGRCSGMCRLVNRPPVARCKDVSVLASNTCTAMASINNLSSDPDGNLDSCTQGPVEPYAIGKGPVTLTCTDKRGKSSSCTGTVEVLDGVAPTIVLTGAGETEHECGEAYTDPGFLATDCAESWMQTSSGQVDGFKPGTYTLTYEAKDPANNIATETRKVTVKDTLPPELQCPPRFKALAESDGAATVNLLAGVQAKDLCSSQTTIEVKVGQEVVRAPERRFPVGITPVEYTATDGSGLQSVCTSTVDVQWDKDFLGGAKGCSATGGESSLAAGGLLVLLTWLARGRQRRAPGRQHPGSRLMAVRLLVLAVLWVGAAAFAQASALPEFELERLKLNPSGQGSLLVGTGELLPHQGYRFALTAHYENDPLVLYENGTPQGVVVAHRATAHLSLAYGLWNRVELGAQVPLVFLQQGDDLTSRNVGSPKGGISLGTPMLSARVGLLSQLDEDAMDLSVGILAGPPVGQAGAMARELRALPSVMVGRRFGYLRGGLDAGLFLRSRVILSEDDNIQDELGHALRLGASLSTTGEKLRGELAVIAAVPLQREGFSVETLAGVRLRLSTSLEVYGLAGLGAGSAPGTPDFRVLLGMAFGKSRTVCVEDGVHEPSDCPDLDDDGDGVRNGDDACPLEPGLAELQGCPLEDMDGDGIPDNEDACPRKAGSTARGGCPAKDTDGDGIHDGRDVCPEEPGIIEMRGCPPKDTDDDGVWDHEDNCPDEPGPADNQGCPVAEKQLVTIQRNRIKIRDTVHFDYNKATIQSRSYSLLDQVARILREHPEIALVSIEGHTDERGSDDYNLDLSQRRADAVRDYLAQKGVERERMRTQGFGESIPLKPEATEEAYAINRRVEFITRYERDEP
jgi:OOP family OmpA-OmpF porin